MIKKKIFDDNDAYFKWFNKNLDKVKIKQIILKNKIVVFFEKED